MRKAVVLLLGTLAGAPVWAQEAKSEPATPAPAKAEAIQDLSTTLESLARRVNPSVVKIVVTGFGITEDSETSNTAMVTRQRASGSGVILTADGYILTNAHVVQGARRIRVQLAPGERAARLALAVKKSATTVVEAKLAGVDRESDVAVLKVDAVNLPHLVLGDSRELRQGQLVMACGSPLGLQNSVSFGVVSAVARQIKPDSAMIYIQTDASINPGNSGGPLVDMAGRVVGLNTMIFSQSGGSEGIGFAIPSEILRSVYTQLRKEGHVHRGEIGISAETITPVIAAGLQLPQDWGVLLQDVTPDGPADQAGLQPGDIVLRLNGRAVEDARQLQIGLYRFPVGQKVSLEIVRGDRHLNLDVVVTAEDNDPQRFADMVDPEKNLIPRLGILGIQIDKRLAALLPDLRKPYGIVVAAKAAAADEEYVDLQAGDVIYSLNNQPTATVEALAGTLKQLKPGDAAVLQIERDGHLKYVAFEME